MAFFFGLEGQTLLKLDGGWKEVSAEDVLSSKRVVCFYFSAHWCPPCRQFTPILKEAYEEFGNESKDLEIVFVSSDRTDEDMKNYMEDSHGSWLAVPRNSDIAQALKTKLGVQGIPVLIVCKRDGSVITKEGRSDVNKGGPALMKTWLQKA